MTKISTEELERLIDNLTPFINEHQRRVEVSARSDHIMQYNSKAETLYGKDVEELMAAARELLAARKVVEATKQFVACDTLSWVPMRTALAEYDEATQ